MGLRDVRKAREPENPYSARAIAKAMGVTVGAYYKWERRPETMSLGTAERLARYLGCEVEELR